VVKWVEKYPENQIRQGIIYTLNQMKAGVEIENIAGYLQSMVRQPILFDIHQEKATKRKKQKDQAQKDAATKAKLEKELLAVYDEQESKESAIIVSICDTHKKAKAKAMEQVSLNPIARDQYDPSLSDTENLQNRVVRISFINAIKKTYPKKFEELDRYYDNKIKKLRLQIVSL